MAVLVTLGLVLLSVSWVVGNPPEASPDEPAALVKAIATGRLQIAGRPYTADLPPYDHSPLGKIWIAKASRSYLLPAGPTPANLNACMAFNAHVTGACLSASPPTAPQLMAGGLVRAPTPDGVYPPYLYLPLGLAVRAATTLDSAYYLGRLASAAFSMVLIGLAVACAAGGRRTRWPVAGLALAVTPMVVFLSASVTTNGMEIAGAVCFWAALLRARQQQVPRWVWLAAGVGGGVMALARQLDDAWLVAGVAVFVALVGPRGAWRRLRSGGAASAVAVALAACGGLASLAWDVLATPSQPVSWSVAVHNAPTTALTLRLFHQAVGVFGWLDTPLPSAAEQAWLAVTGAVVVLALLLGSWRQRATLLATLAALGAGTVLIQMFVLAQIGYVMQARYSLAMGVAVPLLSAEIVGDRMARRVRFRLVAEVMAGAILVVVAALQWTGYYTNARRYGVGSGSSRSLLGHPAWQPPGGTLLWLVTAGAAAACLAAAGVAVASTAPQAQSGYPRRAEPTRGDGLCSDGRDANRMRGTSRRFLAMVLRGIFEAPTRRSTNTIGTCSTRLVACRAAYFSSTRNP